MISIIRRARLPIVFMIALLGLAMSVGSAAAASSTSNKRLSTNDDIQRVYRQRQTQIQDGANQIAGENAYATNLAATIASLQQQGKNVTDLVNGLARFRGQIATSQTAWQQASDLLMAHVGFDAQGNVIDKGQARSTVGSIHTDLMLIKRTATNAKQELSNLLHRYGKTYGVPFGSHAAEDAF